LIEYDSLPDINRQAACGTNYEAFFVCKGGVYVFPIIRGISAESREG